MGENGASSITKSGNVSFQVKGLLRTSWQPRFLVLFSGRTDCHPHLELYDSIEKFKETKDTGKKCDKKYDLNRVKYINKSTQKSSEGVQYIIEIQCKKERHVFSLTDEYEFNDWDYRLNKVVSVLPEKGGELSVSDNNDAEEVVTTNLMYEQTSEAVRFEVTVKEGKLASLCDIAGQHVLCVSDRELAFEEIGTRKIKYCFHFSMLRKFGKQSGAFFFECGRKCPNGEGIVYCVTNDSHEASKIHDVVTFKSRAALSMSRSSDPVKSTAEPNKPSASHVQQQDSTPVYPKATSQMLPTDVDNDIGAPCLATNALRKHPGNTKQPELIPIRSKSTSGSASPPVPKRIPTDRKSVSNGHKLDSVKKHGPVSNEFTKELEHKILPHPPAEEVDRQSKLEDKPQRDLRLSKDRKKSEKEGRKGNEEKKIEKDGKKVKKSESKKGFFSSKKKDKEIKAKPVSSTDPLSLYEDPDEIIDKPKNNVNNKANVNDIYDEAISPNTKVTMVEPAEYAQPYVRKAANNINTPDALMYSDVKIVTDKAWVTHGQEEDMHMEDYLNIKDAREMKEKEMLGRANEPPPLPQKLYDLSDDTYNTLDTGNVPKIVGSQNIYGTAGATPVGKIDGIPIPVTESNVSESEGSSGEIYEGSSGEDPYEDQNDGDEYEDTALGKPALAPKPAVQPKWTPSPMYEEIPQPQASSTKKPPVPKKISVFESVYDEVS